MEYTVLALRYCGKKPILTFTLCRNIFLHLLKFVSNSHCRAAPTPPLAPLLPKPNQQHCPQQPAWRWVPGGHSKGGMLCVVPLTHDPPVGLGIGPSICSAQALQCGSQLRWCRFVPQM